MKNKLLIGIAAATLMTPIGANAEILSSYGKKPVDVSRLCDAAYQDVEDLDEYDMKWDACMSCFFLKDGTVDTTQFRRKGKIEFDTVGLVCYDNLDGSVEIYETINECSILAGDAWDECLLCLQGRYGEIAVIDEGDDEYRGIKYEYQVEYDSGYCYIEDYSLIGCKSGWYGELYDHDSNDLLGCIKCPGDGAESESGIGKTTSITDCYIPAGKQFKDSTGTYTYTADCPYTK